jgi:hypothetical protein
MKRITESGPPAMYVGFKADKPSTSGDHMDVGICYGSR